MSDVARSALRQLDEIDLGILAHLSEDGRRSNVKIAAALGVSQWVVKKRIDRLLRGGVCEIVPIINVEQLGYGPGALVGIETEADKAAAVMTELIKVDDVFWAAYTTGRYDVLAEVIVPEPAQLFDVVARRVSAIEGVTSADAYVVLRETIWKPFHRPSSDIAEPVGERPIIGWTGDGSQAAEGRRRGRTPVAKLDALDQRIVGLLMRDGRRSAAEIARIAGVSTSTVTTRIDRLIERGACRVIGIIEPEELGLTRHLCVGIRTAPSLTAEVGEALARLPQVFWVWHLAGWYHVLADVWLSEDTPAFDFLAEHVRRIPGVRSVETFGIEDAAPWWGPTWAPTESVWRRPARRTSRAGAPAKTPAGESRPLDAGRPADPEPRETARARSNASTPKPAGVVAGGGSGAYPPARAAAGWPSCSSRESPSPTGG